MLKTFLLSLLNPPFHLCNDGKSNVDCHVRFPDVDCSKGVIMPILKCCLIVNNYVWFERYLFLFVVLTVICKRYIVTLFTRPSLFDRSDHVLLLTFWGLDDLRDIIASKMIMTHLYFYTTLNRCTGFLALMICRRLDCTEINNIELFTCMDANLTKKVHYNNAKCFTTRWKNIMHMYIDYRPTVMSSHSSNNALFTLFMVFHNNEDVWVSMRQTKLSVFIHD